MAFYTRYVQKYLKADFTDLVSYSRFGALMPIAFGPLCAYLRSRFGERTGISFVDSTPLAICHIRRIKRHKVFASLAGRGRTSMLLPVQLCLSITDAILATVDRNDLRISN